MSIAPQPRRDPVRSRNVFREAATPDRYRRRREAPPTARESSELLPTLAAVMRQLDELRVSHSIVAGLTLQLLRDLHRCVSPETPERAFRQSNHDALQYIPANILLEIAKLAASAPKED